MGHRRKQHDAEPSQCRQQAQNQQTNQPKHGKDGYESLLEGLKLGLFDSLRKGHGHLFLANIGNRFTATKRASLAPPQPSKAASRKIRLKQAAAQGAPSH